MFCNWKANKLWKTFATGKKNVKWKRNNLYLLYNRKCNLNYQYFSSSRICERFELCWERFIAISSSSLEIPSKVPEFKKTFLFLAENGLLILLELVFKGVEVLVLIFALCLLDNNGVRAINDVLLSNLLWILLLGGTIVLVFWRTLLSVLFAIEKKLTSCVNSEAQFNYQTAYHQ